ncbi:ATP-binding protein [Methanobacterium formicicum]|uniref:Uncharacterized protein n=1 Tax=Methanobacterium formicicum TaxID=2162 RepID=A0A090I8H7_METFO|nr:ATP-binding protein [Methanobacterium formicicum]MDH2659349.1 ATP-binding protein [Methanobacterium formicicum]CEA14645.1 hypothetical protein DSM1535_2295 [Methanobacterium formicicum]
MKYKIKGPRENQTFVNTKSYQKLLSTFKKLSKNRGQIVHVVGAPGTGKSSNIYAAVDRLGLNFYEAKLPLSSPDLTGGEVYQLMVNSMKEDLHVKSSADLFYELSKFDAVLFADRFHDYHCLDEECVGFSQWTGYSGVKPFKFYLTCIREYFKHRSDFKGVNLVLQTAWRVGEKDYKKDLFADYGVLSRVAVTVLGIPFTVVEISYSQEETINIVKSHLNVTPDEVRQSIKKYGNKPRFICQALKDGP